MVRLRISAATSHWEAERAELRHVIAGLEFHIAEERAVAAEAALKAKSVGQGRVHA
jgi:hypothetical protein